MHGSVGEGWREVRRERLLVAASRVFARSRYDEASMEEIAGEAGVGKPTLYRYFASKAELFAAVFDASLDDLEGRLSHVLNRSGPIGATLPRLLAEIVPTFRDHLVPLRLLGAGDAAADRSKRRVFRERRARIARYLAVAIEAGQRRGEVRDIDAARVSHMMIGMIWSATAALPDAAHHEIAHEVCDVVLGGLLRRADPEPERDMAGGWAHETRRPEVAAS